jgi:acyl-CoA synthetase (AMP-forming)/AMP-acid ligase II
VTGPLYHTAPNAYGMFAIKNGGGCILQARFVGEALCAHIEPEPGSILTAGEVRAFLLANLARYKGPKTIEFRRDLPTRRLRESL